MKPREVWETIRIRPPVRGRQNRILAKCFDISDLRKQAQKALPKAVFDYLEGGADGEVTIGENKEAFRAWHFRPNSLVDVSQVDSSANLLDADLPFPLLLAPTGYTRMMHPLGEVAVARAAASRKLPYALSTVSTSSIEDVAEAMRLKSVKSPSAPWMQLYLFKDRAQSWSLLERAEAQGVSVLEFSIDTAVAGRRVRDQRNGFTIPPSLSPSTIVDMGLHFRYWMSMVRAPALTFANFTGADGEATIANITSQFDSALTWADVVELRKRWKGHLVLKGPMSGADAARAVNEGVDAIHLSNHGGRQLDRCMPTVTQLPEVRAAVGSLPIILDSGVRHGMDIATAIALGADAVAVGRAYLYGLATAGEAGVGHALDLLEDQFRRTMQLLGVTSVPELRAQGHRLLTRNEI
jgi:L-lactate dehydrogenase (cytochrome)